MNSCAPPDDTRMLNWPSVLQLASMTRNAHAQCLGPLRLQIAPDECAPLAPSSSRRECRDESGD
eukprot:1595952-Pyramimonas_sp.AAC.1